MHKHRMLLVGWLLLGGSSGCAGDADANGGPAEASPLIHQPANQLRDQSMLSQQELTARTQAAVRILAARLGVGEEAVVVISSERVTWPNGAAGCPRQGVSYTQALVNGYRVVLSHNNREYHYHGRAGADPFYCVRPESPNRWIMDR